MKFCKILHIKIHIINISKILKFMNKHTISLNLNLLEF
ncbi:hypothetical protein CCS77_1096 [Campylobacter concisus]|uniref:Uncharacterized protein n=1 Tax=Campylobacter concisus TaxID=199 RepID=A0A2R4P0E1_9BACT|nr:hypothetical protein CCS77_1096 [Campylobacter concisus]